jgi:hypothetical protein
MGQNTTSNYSVILYPALKQEMTLLHFMYCVFFQKRSLLKIGFKFLKKNEFLKFESRLYKFFKIMPGGFSMVVLMFCLVGSLKVWLSQQSKWRFLM